MKNKIIISISSALILALMITFTSCKKDKADTTTTTPAPTTGMLEFHIHTMIDTAEVDSGMVSPDANGRHFQLNDARFYLSGIQVQKSDGTWLSIPDVVVLKTIEEEEYQIANIPAGNYITVAFDLGLNSTVNATDPSQYSSENPLATSDMYFGSSLGYKFLNIEGFADTTSAQNGPVDSPFSYQLGTSGELVHIQMPDLPFTVLAGERAFLHMSADYGALLVGIDFKTQGVADPATNLSVTQQIAANISQFISYEE